MGVNGGQANGNRPQSPQMKLHVCPQIIYVWVGFFFKDSSVCKAKFVNPDMVRVKKMSLISATFICTYRKKKGGTQHGNIFS